MSRVGNRPIKIDQGVSVTVADGVVDVKSDRGQLNFSLPSGITAQISDGQIKIGKTNDNKNTRALHGLSARLIGNMIHDLRDNYKKVLEFKGTGYRVKAENGKLFLNMGYSHEIVIDIAPGINLTVVKNKIIIEGVDRMAIGQLAAVIRGVRPPEPYKGKGIKYETEIVKKKDGKAAQTTSGKAGA